MFFHLRGENVTLPNMAPEPLVKETERMVYLSVSEYFFDSALFAYYQAGVLNMEIAGAEVPKDLEVLLRASFFGSIVMLHQLLPQEQPTCAKMQFAEQYTANQILFKENTPNYDIGSINTSADGVHIHTALELSKDSSGRLKISNCSCSASIARMHAGFSGTLRKVYQFLATFITTGMRFLLNQQEARMSAKVALRQKALQVQLDLRRFRIYSNQSALESLALIPLQTPLKTLLQLTIMPLINEKTKKGVQIPLPEGMDFMKEVVTNHMGFLTIGADLHFSKGLREVIEKYRTAPGPAPTVLQNLAPSTLAGKRPRGAVRRDNFGVAPGQQDQQQDLYASPFPLRGKNPRPTASDSLADVVVELAFLAMQVRDGDVLQLLLHETQSLLLHCKIPGG
ncbi:hypothetical protein JD844_019421 [Phrynosoma platyrhinos]|uniref:Lipid-binding serum glycoprotein C-terminal domain-containing protein n=1 Tax=Phrynosoma platyrhinos TaxID=52577 RepID=A0ABQ7SPU2_PHRPL|nr:hypothetical protein JD844_019421 [Phrynosoma platyrhinos]